MGNRNVRQHLSFRGSSHTLPADRLRVYHSLQHGTCRLEIVLIRYLPTSSEFITHRKNLVLCMSWAEGLTIAENTYALLVVSSGFFYLSLILSFLPKLSKKVGILAHPLQKIGIVYTYLIRMTQ